MERGFDLPASAAAAAAAATAAADAAAAAALRRLVRTSSDAAWQLDKRGEANECLAVR